MVLCTFLEAFLESPQFGIIQRSPNRRHASIHTPKYFKFDVDKIPTLVDTFLADVISLRFQLVINNASVF